MSRISRRDFFKNAAAGAAVAGCLSGSVQELFGNPLGMPIGCQTYPVRDMIAKDFPGTIKVLAAAGFERVELCSPVGYADSGFAGLAKYKPAELRKILADAGVKCISSHFDINELRKDQQYGGFCRFLVPVAYCCTGNVPGKFFFRGVSLQTAG